MPQTTSNLVIFSSVYRRKINDEKKLYCAVDKNLVEK